MFPLEIMKYFPFKLGLFSVKLLDPVLNSFEASICNVYDPIMMMNNIYEEIKISATYLCATWIEA